MSSRSDWIGRIICVVAFLFLFMQPSEAKTSAFVRVSLGPNESMEVPKNWRALSGNARTTIDSFVEAAGFKQVDSSLPFAANLLDDHGKTIAIVNVRFYPENDLTQADARAITQSELQVLQSSLLKGFERASQVSAGNVLRSRGIGKRLIHGNLAIVHEDNRTNIRDGLMLRNRGVRFWRSPRSFTVNMNYRESDAIILGPIIEYMTNSIVAN